MPTIEIPTDDAVAMVRAIRDKMYEETKDMTQEELWAYENKQLEEAHRRMKEVNPADYDLSWLTAKK